MSTYALILAGGSGTRFWPLSRNRRPKQLLNLLGETTLLTQTVDRLLGLLPAQNILILTNPIQEEAVREVATQLPPENILSEPCKRDTAPAIAYGAGLIAARDPEATMMVLPSDQLIDPVEPFQALLADAIALAEQTPALVTIGIRPSWACPSYGYIERGESWDEQPLPNQHPVRRVVRFREKPSPDLAEEFLEAGNFVWNAGMFLWSLPTLRAEFEKNSPVYADFVTEVAKADPLRHPERQEDLAASFSSLPATSIDYALMEKASQVLNLEATTFKWDDVGSWISVSQYLEEDADKNTSNTPLVQVESQQNIVFNQVKNSQITLLGVEHLIVVQTPDALLVADRTRADDIKKLVAKIPSDLQ